MQTHVATVCANTHQHTEKIRSSVGMPARICVCVCVCKVCLCVSVLKTVIDGLVLLHVEYFRSEMIMNKTKFVTGL